LQAAPAAAQDLPPDDDPAPEDEPPPVDDEEEVPASGPRPASMEAVAE
jgi:hypothetical protein